MKSSSRLILLLLALSLLALHPRLTFTARAQQVLLNDQFNGTSIDSSLWMTSDPFSTSSITESGGSAIFQDRGQLVTQNVYPTSLVITGSFTITGDPTDEFKIVLRTDGTFQGNYNESANGFCVRFRGPAASGPGDDEVSIFDLASSTAAGWTGTLNPSTAYNFKITDDGFTMAVYLTDLTTPKVVLSSTTIAGNRIALYNRENDGATHLTHLDFLTIAAGPGKGSVTDLWDVSNGTTIVDHSPLANYLQDASRPFDPSAMFGAVFPNLPLEPDDVIFEDTQQAGYVYYMEWQTPSPVTVQSFDLYAHSDTGSESREFESMRLLAKSAGSSTYDLVLADITPAHPYNYFDEAHSLLISSDIPTTTAQDFRVEFVNRLGATYVGPRIYELDGFATTSAQNHLHSIVGPVNNPSNGHTYYLLDSASWMNAEAQAVALGGHLATVRNADENQWIIEQFAGGSTDNRRLWIGLHRVANDDVFGWTSNEADTYTNWASGEPNSASNTDGYTFIVQPTADPNFPLLVPGEWNDTFDTDTGADGREPYGVVEVDPADQFTFSYGYKTPYDANADQYVVATSDAQKYTESFSSPPTLYWGPTSNDVNATLNMRFDFASPTTEVRLHAELAAFNFTNSNEGFGTGSCSLYGSTDGTNWTLLLDDPTPSEVASYQTYDQDVPASLVGAMSFYVQVRFYTDGAPVPSYTVAQFSRSDGNRTTDVFHLSANTSAAGTPSITSAATATANVGMPFSYEIAAANGPTTFNATSLPAGLSINTATGLISGTASMTGLFNVGLSAANAAGTGTTTLVLTVATASAHVAFFDGEVALSNGVYYLSFPSGNYFGFYSFLTDPAYIYHFDLGYEYIFDAADGNDGVYLYDFKSDGFFYTSPTFSFPYLYDFNLNSVVYYYPDPNNAGHYNTDGVRYFYDFNIGQIISK